MCPRSKNQNGDGLADNNVGLYVLKIQSVKVYYVVPPCNFVKDNIWHVPLGHPFTKRIAIIKPKYPYIYLTESVKYDIFHFEKQKKLSFFS